MNLKTGQSLIFSTAIILAAGCEPGGQDGDSSEEAGEAGDGPVPYYCTDDDLFRDNVGVGTVAEVDLYVACRGIIGDLWIEGPIDDLSGFENLEFIQGDVRINGTQLENLRGFGKLQEIGGDLQIAVNASLTDISDVEHFSPTSSSPWVLDVRMNPLLTTLVLPDVGSSPTDFSLTAVENAAMDDVSALSSVDEFTDLELSGLGLTQLSAEAAPASVSGTLTVLGNLVLPQDDAEIWAASIVSGNAKIAGNLGFTPLDGVCPWEDDGICDEDCVTDICVTDFNDCGGEMPICD